MGEPIEMPIGCGLGCAQGTMYWVGVHIPMGKGNFEGEGYAQTSTTFCHELCKNGLTDRDAVWVMDSDGPKEACVRWGSDLRAKGQFLGEK